MLDKRVVVIGIGNLLLRDEGIGVHVVHSLQESPCPGNVEIIDGGISPHIIYDLEGVDKLIVIDAVRAGGEPGAVYRFELGDLAWEEKVTTSLHELGLGESLRMMEMLGNRPEEVVIIGVEPGEIDWGLGLSSKLEQRLPEVVRSVLKEIGIS